MDPIAPHDVRLLLVGPRQGEFLLAAEMAREQGADVEIADNLSAAIEEIKAGRRNAAMIDVSLDAPRFIRELREADLAAPVIACGIDALAVDAVAAIRAGARDYVPLPPERELIGAAIALAASGLSGSLEVGALVGHTVADVERELILHTLDHCHGNRTSASTILGISVRTMRNKLRTFIEAGIPVAPPSTL